MRIVILHTHTQKKRCMYTWPIAFAKWIVIQHDIPFAYCKTLTRSCAFDVYCVRVSSVWLSQGGRHGGESTRTHAERFPFPKPKAPRRNYYTKRLSILKTSFEKHSISAIEIPISIWQLVLVLSSGHSFDPPKGQSMAS